LLPGSIAEGNFCLVPEQEDSDSEEETSNTNENIPGVKIAEFIYFCVTSGLRKLTHQSKGHLVADLP